MSVSQHIAGALLGITFVGTSVYWATDREPPVIINSVDVVGESVEPGATLRIAYSVERLRVCRTTAQATIFDGADVEWRFEPRTQDVWGPVTSERKVVQTTVPAGATPGRARYRLSLSFRCNPLQDLWPLTLSPPDNVFNIRNSEDAK